MFLFTYDAARGSTPAMPSQHGGIRSSRSASKFAGWCAQRARIVIQSRGDGRACIHGVRDVGGTCRCCGPFQRAGLMLAGPVIVVIDAHQLPLPPVPLRCLGRM